MWGLAIALGGSSVVAPLVAWWAKRPASAIAPSDGAPSDGAPSDGAPSAPELPAPAAPVLSAAAQQQQQVLQNTAALLKGAGMLTGAGGLGVVGAAWAAGQGVGDAAFAVSKALGASDADAYKLRRAAGLATAGGVVAGPVGALVGGGVQLAAEGLSAAIGAIAGKDVEKSVRDAVSLLDPTRADTVPGRLLAAPAELVGLIGDSLTGKLPPQPELTPEVAAREAAHKAYYAATREERAQAGETWEAAAARAAAGMALGTLGARAAATVAKETRIGARRRLEE